LALEMRGVVLIATLAVVIGCGAGSGTASQSATPSTKLTIRYWPAGIGEGPVKTWTLRCNPTGGTLVRSAAACRKLAALGNPFARPKLEQMCTQQYGGPDQAQITGTYRGRQVFVALGLTDGCQIARFKTLSFLIPAYR
jgi:hypothetical protein